MKLLEIENEDQQKLALHYVMCLLPKPNLDVLMVLLSFLEEVSYHSGVNQEWGNKMDLDNLATGMFLFLQTVFIKSHGAQYSFIQFQESIRIRRECFYVYKGCKTITPIST